MQLIKNIIGRIWAFWGLLSFIITFIIIFPFSMLGYLFPEPKGTEVLLVVSRAWMRVWLFLVGCPLKVVGKENFKNGKSYIVACNHNSLLDIPLSSPFIPGTNKTIAKSSFAKVPIFGWFYAKGSVLVDRKDERSRRRSFDKMKWVLKTGMHMCIYPEGTRNRTNKPLKPFYAGAFKLATETKSPIIPTIILNTKKAVPLHKTFYFLPHKLEMHFLPEVSSNDISAEELKNKVYQIMETYYVAHQH